ncbi:MAG: ATP-binding protein [Deltaproteobacteria bacterium]|nr:ATP-binding protein [Deltaproteobacteria bacterium]
MDIPFPEKLIPRKILQRIIPFLEAENIILLTGARQTGKTSLLYLIIEYLWQKGLSPLQTAFFDLENIHDFDLINGLKDFDDFWQILKAKGVDPHRRVVVFIDEIQHLDKPSSFLKYLHDHNKPRLKFIVTGSSSLEIKKKFTDRLTGRVYRFIIRPLDFQEFLEFKNEKDLAEIVSSFDFNFWVFSKFPEKDFQSLDPDEMKRLNYFLDEYLIYGGYPAVTLKENPVVRQRDIQEIYSLYIRRDIKDIGEIADVSGYNNLVTLLCLQIGNLIKDQELAVSSGLSRPTIKKYLFLLENTYVLSLVPPFFTNKRSEVIKTPKVYFNDAGMRNGVVNNFVPLKQRTDRGAILENFVFTQLSGGDDLYQKIRFWRSHSKKEVDFVWQEDVEKPYPIEVKSQYMPRQPLPSGLKSFIGSYGPSRAYIAHMGEFNMLDFKGTTIFVIPAWSV